MFLWVNIRVVPGEAGFQKEDFMLQVALATTRHTRKPTNIEVNKATGCVMTGAGQSGPGRSPRAAMRRALYHRRQFKRRLAYSPE